LLGDNLSIHEENHIKAMDQKLKQKNATKANRGRAASVDMRYSQGTPQSLEMDNLNGNYESIVQSPLVASTAVTNLDEKLQKLASTQKKQNEEMVTLQTQLDKILNELSSLNTREQK